MTDLFHDDIAEKAMEALKKENAAEAAESLRAVLLDAPTRVDVIHALAVTELRLGHASAALALSTDGEKLAREQGDESALRLMAPLFQVRAAAYEDLYDPAGAEAAHRAVLEHEPDNPRTRSALGYLLLSWGRTDEGLAELKGYMSDRTDQTDYVEGARVVVDAVERFIRDDVHPRVFIEAHRGSYVEFFDHHAKAQEAKGWIAEAARMHRDDAGQVVPIIPEGARPYAGTRVDLVDPKTGQVGRVGDIPMVVAVADYEPLAQSTVLFDWPERDVPFKLWISSQVPWNNVAVQVRFEPQVADAVAALDPVVGSWYSAGYDGEFGTREAGRFHEISDPEPPDAHTVVYHVDCGRAQDGAVQDLIRRLSVLHEQHPIAHVLIGRGFVPVG